jgi:hypothetical protein
MFPTVKQGRITIRPRPRSTDAQNYTSLEPICNTSGVYIPLDNEYGVKHVISVDKTDVKF